MTTVAADGKGPTVWLRIAVMVVVRVWLEMEDSAIVVAALRPSCPENASSGVNRSFPARLTFLTGCRSGVSSGDSHARSVAVALLPYLSSTNSYPYRLVKSLIHREPGAHGD